VPPPVAALLCIELLTTLLELLPLPTYPKPLLTERAAAVPAEPYPPPVVVSPTFSLEDAGRSLAPLLKNSGVRERTRDGVARVGADIPASRPSAIAS
jgi:hypothetical protein